MDKEKPKMMQKKLDKLKKILKRLKSVVIAYSGGVDSTFLLKVAQDVLGADNVIAVTAQSESFPRRELAEAKKYAAMLQSQHVLIRTHELKNKQFARNPVNRCYYCKKELFAKMKRIATTHRMAAVADGSNFDDLKDMRYGRQAARELDIKSPLVDAGLTKREIRQLSKTMHLPTWNKGTFACLASRFPYRQRINRKDLLRIERAEDFLRSLGFRQVRVRLHRDMARIEVGSEEIGRCLQEAVRKKISTYLQRLGFNYITVDLAGYRTGSMNEILSA